MARKTPTITARTNKQKQVVIFLYLKHYSVVFRVAMTSIASTGAQIVFCPNFLLLSWQQNRKLNNRLSNTIKQAVIPYTHKTRKRFCYKIAEYSVISINWFLFPWLLNIVALVNGKLHVSTFKCQKECYLKHIKTSNHRASICLWKCPQVRLTISTERVNTHQY